MNYCEKGINLRMQIKELVYDFMKNTEECSNLSDGLKQAEFFRSCGLDWGGYSNATSSNQQYWIVALLRELEVEGKVQRDSVSKKWRVT